MDLQQYPLMNDTLITGMRRNLPNTRTGVRNISKFEMLNRTQKGNRTYGMKQMKGGTLSGGRLDKTKNKSHLIKKVKEKKKKTCGQYDKLNSKNKLQLYNLLKNPP